MPTSPSNPPPPFPTGDLLPRRAFTPYEILKFADRLGRPDENLARIGAVTLTESWTALCRAFGFPVDSDVDEVVAWLRHHIPHPASTPDGCPPVPEVPNARASDSPGSA